MCEKGSQDRYNETNSICIRCRKLDARTNSHYVDIAFVISVLGRFQSFPGMDHPKDAKEVMRYLEATKTFMVVYGNGDDLETFGYPTLI